MRFVLEVAYHNDRPVQPLRSEADIARFIDELLAADEFHSSASVYAIDEATNADPDHEMIIGVDGERRLGAIRYSGGEPIPGDDAETWFSQGGSTNPDGVVFGYFGNAHDFPADSEVPLDLVKQAMRELLVSCGKRPTSVRWQTRI